MQRLYDKIKSLIAEGKAAEAAKTAEEALQQGEDPQLYYLLGNARLKAADRRGAICAYRRAEEMDPDSPAAEARQLMDNIMDFYNKDLYNP